MDRRTALATAGAIAIITITGGTAIAANLGVLDRSPDEPAGQLQPNDPGFSTVIVEPADDTLAVQPTPATSRETRTDDHADDHDDDRAERDDREEDDEEHEYEGRDDDD